MQHLHRLPRVVQRVLLQRKRLPCHASPVVAAACLQLQQQQRPAAAPQLFLGAIVRSNEEGSR